MNTITVWILIVASQISGGPVSLPVNFTTASDCERVAELIKETTNISYARGSAQCVQTMVVNSSMGH